LAGGKGENVISVDTRWQVTLYDPIRHSMWVPTAVKLATNCYTLCYLLASDAAQVAIHLPAFKISNLPRHKDRYKVSLQHISDAAI